MNAIHSIAALIILTTAGAVFSHEGGHPAPARAGVAEQKPWGIAGQPRQVQRTITLTMGDDMRFQPDRLEIRLGETVRLRVRNTGRLLHELVIGTPEELAAHAAQMLKHPDMEHDEPYMTHVRPGQTGEIVWTFNRAGEFDFACLIAGHYQAGMKGRISVR
ncbi:MAG: plastocyanin/azurin family copper-binding protein [Hylemonella sp.]|mgnify:CR=1 FL=1